MGAHALHCKGLVALSAAAFLLGGCTSSIHRAPVEQRGGGNPVGTPTTPVAVLAETASPSSLGTAAAVKPPPPGAENAGKPGYYTVKPGDTMIHIALDAGQNWRDIARWNNIDNP